MPTHRKNDTSIHLHVTLLIFCFCLVECSFYEKDEHDDWEIRAEKVSQAWCYSMKLSTAETHAGCKADLARTIRINPTHPLIDTFHTFYCKCETDLLGYEYGHWVDLTKSYWFCGRLKCDRYFARATVNSSAYTNPADCLIATNLPAHNHLDCVKQMEKEPLFLPEDPGVVIPFKDEQDITTTEKAQSYANLGFSFKHQNCGFGRLMISCLSIGVLQIIVK